MIFKRGILKSKTAIVDFILFYIFVVSAFFEMFNAYVKRVAGTTSPIINVYRGSVIVLLVWYFLMRAKYHRIIYLFFTLLFLYVVSFAYWILRGYPTSIVAELKLGLSWFFYPHLVMLFLLSSMKYLEMEKLINYIIAYACLFALSFVFSFLTGNALQYYGGRAFSFSGLIISGNDFALMMLMTNCMTCYLYFTTAKARYAVVNLVIAAMTILIGSVAGIFGSAVIMVLLVTNKLFVRNYRKLTRRWQRAYAGCLFAIGIPILIFVINFLITFSEFTRNKFSFERLSSGGARRWLKNAAIENLRSFTPLDWLFGTGADSMERRIGKLIGTSVHSVEIDHYDEISAYGILFGGLCWLLPLLFTCLLITKYIRYKSEFYFWSSLAMGLFVVHGFFAGHASISILALQAAAVIFYCHCKTTRERRDFTRCIK